MDCVVRGSEHQGIVKHVPQAICSNAEGESKYAQREIDHAKDQREGFCCRERAGEAEVQCDNARDNVDDIVCRR